MPLCLTRGSMYSICCVQKAQMSQTCAFWYCSLVTLVDHESLMLTECHHAELLPFDFVHVQLNFGGYFMYNIDIMINADTYVNYPLPLLLPQTDVCKHVSFARILTRDPVLPQICYKGMRMQLLAQIHHLSSLNLIFRSINATLALQKRQ